MKCSTLKPLVSVAVLAWLATAACSSKQAALLETCAQNEDCETGICAPPLGYDPSFCTQKCDDGVCPTGSTCTTYASGERLCVKPCEQAVFGSFACNELHTPVLCDHGGREFDCSACGCAEGLFCGYQPGADHFQCQAPRAVGAPCDEHSECASKNCGALPGQTAKTCFDPANDACSDATCGSCDFSDGALICAQACETHAECGDPHYRCYGAGTTGYCRLYCDFVACPVGFSCQRVDDPELLIVSKFCFPNP